MPGAGEKPWQFQKGQSGNPAGRPKGSKNKATLLAESMLAGDVEAVTRMALDRAAEGDGAMQRFFLARLLAPERQRRVALDLPELTGRPAQDAAAAYEVVYGALAAGELAPAEALAYAEFIDRLRAVQEAAVKDEKLDEIRARQEVVDTEKAEEVFVDETADEILIADLPAAPDAVAADTARPEVRRPPTPVSGRSSAGAGLPSSAGGATVFSTVFSGRPAAGATRPPSERAAAAPAS